MPENKVKHFTFDSHSVVPLCFHTTACITLLAAEAMKDALTGFPFAPQTEERQQTQRQQ